MIDFAHRDNGDGSHTLIDVPVFWANESEHEGETFAWTDSWVGAAFERLRSWERDGHLPPMTEGHRTRQRPEPRGVGHFRATRVGTLNGRATIFADLTYTDERAWEDAVKQRRPYRSAEVSFPGEGDPEVESLALLENAPRLQMPMTRVRVTGVTEGQATTPNLRGSLAAAFAAERCYVQLDTPTKPKVKLSGVTGRFAEEPPEPKEDPPKPPKEDPKEAPKAAAGGLSEAVALLTAFMAMPVPLQDVKAAISMLEEKLAQLKGATASEEEPEEADGEPEGDEDAPGARPSDDVAEPSGKNTPPRNGKEPMNMSADPKAGAAEATRMAKFEAEQTALRGEVDEFKNEQKRERAIFAAVRDLADFNIGGDPEAKVREVVTKAGQHWEIALATFAATSKEVAPRRTRTLANGAVEKMGDATTPPEIAALGLASPEEGRAAFAAHAQWKTHGCGTAFPDFWKFNRAHFGAPVRS